MQKKNYVAVLIGIVALVALVASGCTPEVPTGNYAQGSNVHALKAMLGMINGAFIPPPGVCGAIDNSGCTGGEDDAECCTGAGEGTCFVDAAYAIAGTNKALDNSACVGEGDPAECCTAEGEGTCPSAAPIQYAATTEDDPGVCSPCYGFALADVSPPIPDNEDCVAEDDPADCCTGEGTGTCTVTVPGSVLAGAWVDCSTEPPGAPTACTLTLLTE